MWSGRRTAIGSIDSIYPTVPDDSAALVTWRPTLLNTLTLSHLVRTVVMIFLVAIVRTHRLVVSKAMAVPQVALVKSHFLPPVKALLVTMAIILSFSQHAARVFLCCVVTGDMVTIVSSMVTEVTPLPSVSLILVVVKTALLPPAGILVVVLKVYLTMRCGASQQLFHFAGRQLRYRGSVTWLLKEERNMDQHKDRPVAEADKAEDPGKMCETGKRLNRQFRVLIIYSILLLSQWHETTTSSVIPLKNNWITSSTQWRQFTFMTEKISYNVKFDSDTNVVQYVFIKIWLSSMSLPSPELIIVSLTLPTHSFK